MKIDEPCFCFCFDEMTFKNIGSNQFNLLAKMHAINMSAILSFSHSVYQDELRVEFFTNTQICQLCIPIYFQFPSLSTHYSVSKCKIRYQWVLDD